MEKFELEDSLKEEIRSRTLGEGFIKLVQSVRRGGGRFRISLRPVEIGGERKYQAEMSEGRDVQVKNFDANGAARASRRSSPRRVRGNSTSSPRLEISISASRRRVMCSSLAPPASSARRR
ncbi:MAG: hypothetical protein IJG18_08150 [Kiritimatiellae bacterium]|nr:hypothetical protein [Kiritimatiellia bacterium]